MICVGSVRDLQRVCCQLALKNHPGLDWAEFGVSRGWSARFFLKILPKGSRIFLFDSWEGLPEAWEKVRKGSYRATVPEFKDGRAHLIKGLFDDTVEDWAKTQKSPLGFIHMDADLYSSTILALSALHSLIVPGTIILFDEYSGILARMTNTKPFPIATTGKPADMFESELRFLCNRSMESVHSEGCPNPSTTTRARDRARCIGGISGA